MQHACCLPGGLCMSCARVARSIPHLALVSASAPQLQPHFFITWDVQVLGQSLLDPVIFKLQAPLFFQNLLPEVLKLKLSYKSDMSNPVDTTLDVGEVCALARVQRSERDSPIPQHQLSHSATLVVGNRECGRAGMNQTDATWVGGGWWVVGAKRY